MARHFLEEFEAFWAAYPKRAGNPKEPARKQWMRLAQLGQLPTLEFMIGAAKAYGAHCRRENIPGEFIAHARTWLFQKRFNDWGPDLSAPQLVPVIPNALRKFADMNPQAWAMWLSKCEIAIDDNSVRIKADTQFSADYIARNFSSQLAATCRRHVSIQVGGENGKGPGSLSRSPEPSGFHLVRQN